MKIQIDGVVRDMTPDEEREWVAWHEKMPSPDDPTADEVIDYLFGGDTE